MNEWNQIYMRKGPVQERPSSRAISAIQFFREYQAKCVLDLGCGTGRNTLLLRDEGFEVIGCDTSAEALRLLQQQADDLQLHECDMTALPFADAAFDGIFCYQVIQHGRIADIEEATAEMLRVLQPGGCLFLTTVSPQHAKYQTGHEIEPRTRVDTDAVDGHIPHHFFIEEELRDIFQGFDIRHLEHFMDASELQPDQVSAGWEMRAVKFVCPDTS
jgi:ubiquinone/menaquinone biosynthesis C-methylase UbiE